MAAANSSSASCSAAEESQSGSPGSHSLASAASNSEKFFDPPYEHPEAQLCHYFWFPLLEPPATFRAAFTEANRAVGVEGNGDADYHSRFEGAWDAAFPRCRTHAGRHVPGCAGCLVPKKERHAVKRSSEFGGDAPDYHFIASNTRKGWAGALDIKRKDSRSTSFTKDDITQIVRYGNHILATQPLRDHATVCLFTLELVQFFQVFRGSRVIRTMQAQQLNEDSDAFSQLFSYLTASAAVHGIREITLDGLFIPLPADRLGSGSFSTVLRVRTRTHGDAALKLYQRFAMVNAVEFDTTLFDSEVEILKSIAGSRAAQHAPSIIHCDKALQYILLTPVGTRLTFEKLSVKIMGDLVDAVRALHAVCIHRDLRAANILLVKGRVLIIDWNLGLQLNQLTIPQTPAGAVSVQGFGVLTARSVEDLYSYTPSDDLQSLVRALYLLAHNVAVSPKMTALEWKNFWERRLQGPVPPGHMFSHWVAAEEAAVRGDYDELKRLLQTMLTK